MMLLMAILSGFTPKILRFSASFAQGLAFPTCASTACGVSKYHMEIAENSTGSA